MLRADKATKIHKDRKFKKWDNECINKRVTNQAKLTLDLKKI
jgi:hypothetical protein